MFTKFKLVILALIFLSCSVFSHAQDFVYNTNFNYARADIGMPLPSGVNRTGQAWQLSWNGVGNLKTCQVQLDVSADGVTWIAGGLFGSTPCTTSSQFALKGPGLPQIELLPSGGVMCNSNSTKCAPIAFVRVNVTALSGGGSLNVSLKLWTGP